MLAFLIACIAFVAMGHYNTMSNFIVALHHNLCKHKFAKEVLEMFIFRASFTRNGVTYYARDYGKRAFKIYIDKKTGIASVNM